MTQLFPLRHGDTVRLATWTGPYARVTAEVGTARGYAAEGGRDPEAFHALTVQRGHDTAWTVQIGASLTNSKAFNDAKRAKEDAALARAVTLAHGDLVEIEGQRFTVHVNAGNLNAVRNSDPIAFRRA